MFTCYTCYQIYIFFLFLLCKEVNPSFLAKPRPPFLCKTLNCWFVEKPVSLVSFLFILCKMQNQWWRETVWLLLGSAEEVSNVTILVAGHCTMRFQKKRAKNVQLWTLVSPRIFIEKSWNFAQSCLNSSRIWGLFFWEKKPRKKCGKNQKTCWGCFRKSRVVSKKSSRKKNFFLENALFAETPPSSKKMGF